MNSTFTRRMGAAMKKLLIQALALLAIALVAFGVWRFVEARQNRPVPPTAASSSSVPPETVAATQSVDFEALRLKYPDVVAWLNIDGPGVKIDYPVVQSEDNNQYYLKRTPAGEKSKYGSIFMDFRSHGDFSDFYSVIYGHNITSDNKGFMFTQLVKFKDRDVFDAIPTAKLYTPTQAYALQIFACAVTDHMSDYYLNLAFFAPAEKEAHLAMLKRTAKYWRDIPIGNDDHIVVLSTCSYEFENARTVILGKLVPLSPEPAATTTN